MTTSHLADPATDPLGDAVSVGSRWSRFGDASAAWPRAFVGAMSALSIRGRAFVAGGLTATTCGLVLGERDLVRIGVLIVLIPVLTAIGVARGGQRLSLTRSVAASVVEVNQSTVVTLELTNNGTRTGLLLAEEQVPWALGQRPRFTIGWLRPGGQRTVGYPVRAEVRGIYEIGPLLVKVADPFGMIALRRELPRTATLVVVPPVEELPSLAPLGAWSGSGDNRPQPFSVGNAADTTVREYRVGDDLRRVHWRSTARTGELMVRREEQPWQARCTLYLDNRTGAHRGSGPDSSFERAVAATASLAVHLVGLGFGVHLTCADGRSLEHTGHDGDPSTQTRGLLEHLAAVRATTNDRLTTPWVDETTAGLFIAVLGTLDAHDRDVLSRLQTRSSASYAVCVDTESWTARGSRSGVPTGAAFLRGRGWKAADLPRGGTLTQTWTELNR